jgi:hypothetical protein
MSTKKGGNMIRIVFVALLLDILLVQAAPGRLTLQQAIDKRMVKATARSTGGHGGYCMQVTVQNLTRDSIIILIEAGRRLNSVNDQQQDILVVKELTLALKKFETRSEPVKGYCCQASNASPSKNAAYHINTLADSSLVLLAKYLNTHPFEASAEQYAVWAISNNKPSANITSVNDSVVLPLRRFVAGIKKEILPWYTLEAVTQVNSLGGISTHPLILKGALEYANGGRHYGTCYVLNEKGMQVCTIKGGWLESTAGKILLSIPVAGLAKGSYKIELRTMDELLVCKEFKI